MSSSRPIVIQTRSPSVRVDLLSPAVVRAATTSQRRHQDDSLIASLCLPSFYVGVRILLFVYTGSIQTPREVYKELNSQGHRVDYRRIPVTTGHTPDPTVGTPFWFFCFQ